MIVAFLEMKETELTFFLHDGQLILCWYNTQSSNSEVQSGEKICQSLASDEILFVIPWII